MLASRFLGFLGSLPEARSVFSQALVTMFPSLMLRHMILAEGLVAILALLVEGCYTSTFFAFFQLSNQR
jgi:hypothetical protein